MEIGELEVTTIALSRNQDGDNTVYVLSEGSRQSHWDWKDEFPTRPVKLVSGFYVDDTAGRWFLFANVDCFDPSVYVIRARTFETAYEVFCDEFAQKAGLIVDEADADDTPEEEWDYNASGQHISTEGVHGFQVQFVAAFNF